MTTRIAQTYSDLSTKAGEQLKKELGGSLQEFQTLRNVAVHTDIARTKESTEAQIKLVGLKDYYDMRRSWGNFLKWCLIVILAFNILLVLFVGMEWLKFKDEWFLRIVLTTNLADIIGLVYLVVKFLFSNQADSEDKKTPKS